MALARPSPPPSEPRYNTQNRPQTSKGARTTFSSSSVPPLAEFQVILHILMDCVEGEKSLPNGDLYIGSLFGPLPEGRGKYLWLNGCMYEGMWCKGKKMGKGKVSWPSGSTYEGEFMGGCLHGYGTFSGVNGGTYKGHWVLNQMHGVGKKCYTNGDIYEGQWQHGLQEGDGRYMWVNGDEYIGQWRVGKMCGKGTMKWSNGDKYDGLWQDGLQHGQGLYRWSLHGSLYVGTWNMGLKEGKGIFYPNMCPTQDEVYYSPARGGDFDRDSHSSSVSDLESLASFHGSSFDGTPSRTFISQRMNSFDTENTEDSSVSDSSVNSLDEFEEAGSSVGDTSEESLSLVVEREYSQGVLVHEFVKENVPVKGSKKQKKVYKEGKKQGETIFKGHRNYDLMLSLQLGIRYTVGRITPEPKRDIVTADFGPKAKICMRFPPEGSASTPPHQSTEFKWKDYCPLVFRHLREVFNIDAADYMLSICGSNALREFSSPGKSGSLFYMSHDDSFMIKTMRKSEVKVLLRMLPNYYNHVRTYQNTLITRFFGVHAIKPTGGQKIRFVVMHNMFCSDLRIHRRFDLKGSSQGRSTHKTEIEETTTLKDLDLDFVFHVEPSWRRELIKQIEMDCKLLAKEKIMDYSLLLGVHIRSSQSSTMFSPARVPHNFSLTQNKMSTLGGYNKRGILDADDPDFDSKLHVRLGVNMPARAVQKQSKNKQRFQHEPEEYEVVLYFGIIDILQEYDVSKKLEHAYKALQFDAFTISSVDPKQYSKRFREFISKVFPA